MGAVILSKYEVLVDFLSRILDKKMMISCVNKDMWETPQAQNIVKKYFPNVKLMSSKISL